MSKEKGKPHIQVTAGLIRKDGRVLITRRPDGSHLAGTWEFPGGKQEAGETLKTCLEREIREELGVDVRAEKLLFVVKHEYDARVVTLNLFECACLKGKPKALEGQEIRWVYPGETSKIQVPAS